jgi:general L-amino acid transport system substrate-binding protein
VDHYEYLRLLRDDDPHWLTLVRWVLVSLIAAEESGVTRQNVRERMRDPVMMRALDPGEDIDTAIRVALGWQVRAVESVGNYGELFERDHGSHSPLNLDRGLNQLWTQGGLMYAPPVR